MAISDQTKTIINRIKAKLAILKITREWLDREYPKDGGCRGKFDKENKGNWRRDIKNLNISSKILKDRLDLSDFVDLETLDCSGNKISFLEIKDLTKLKSLNCSINQIKEIDLSENVALQTLRCHRNPLLEKITGLERLKELTAIESKPFKIIDQLRNGVNRVFLTGINRNSIDYPVGYYSNQLGNNLLDREISSCKEVINTSSKDIPRTQRNQAQHEIEAYEAKIEQIKPWLQN